MRKGEELLRGLNITIPVKESFITRLPIPIFGPFKTLLLILEIFLVEFKMSPAEFEIIVATHMRSVAEFEISRGADSRSNGKVADIMWPIALCAVVVQH